MTKTVFETDFDRVEVINNCQRKTHAVSVGLGRICVATDVKIELSMQDDGKTLKIFLSDK